MTGTRQVAEATGAEILIHKADKEYYDSLAGQYRMFGMPRSVDDPLPVKRFLKDGEKIDFGKHALKVIHTPGHTQGSISLWIPAENKLIAGDTLFRDSIGRTDLPGGNPRQILRSIEDKLLGLPEETIVVPGHGPNTTIGREKERNPFLQGL